MKKRAVVKDSSRGNEHIGIRDHLPALSQFEGKLNRCLPVIFIRRHLVQGTEAALQAVKLIR
ncbi:MAG: hypothetical protein NTW48_09015 [Chloroflexi bacterium]|nr:hypothetical protein [Chloroflexota bacterium]